ncbi:glycosyltransferase family 9 protein [Poseidonibacter lekithochrous]|uniref:glycosyltransferase family 9 protein n=1 Tax=Poseidonibacter lekithochrous TaxID=1904463 RepID=UPI0008FC3835|nr:glycosyltransferase family 9 protein [Poseidonibacter lekithochrous]QKJ23779.1 glycosyltransferase, family 9 [Poseidonibacter lekithochrous]
MKIIKYLNKIIPFSSKKDVELKNILVVSNTGFGDTILTTPSIKSLRVNYPTIRINFLVNSNFYSLFENFEYVDNVLKYKSGFFNQIKLIKKLKKLNIDTIFLFHSNGPEDIFFSKLSGARAILKMTHNKNHDYKDIFLNNPVSIEQHDIENRLDLVRLYSGVNLSTIMSVPKRFYNTEPYFKDQSKTYIAFQLGAQDTFKMWPLESFIDLANKLLKDDSTLQIVVLGATKYEVTLTKEFISKVNEKDRIIDLCAKTKVDILPTILNQMKLLVSNDTGTMHLSIALKKRTICLFGPTKSNMFGPYQDLKLHDVIQKDIKIDTKSFSKKDWTQDTMNQICVDEVYNKIVREVG